MNKKIFFMLIPFLFTAPVLADTTTVQLSADCTTEGTTIKGGTQKCSTSDRPSIVKAPDGYVFIKDSLQGGEFSGAGDHHACIVGWSDEIEIIAGSKIYLPKTITLYAEARSPVGVINGGKRGWAKCTYTLTATKYK